MRKLLAVRQTSVNYNPNCEVTYARSFEHAKEMIEREEMSGKPFDDLDLPISNERDFWKFVDWLEETYRKRYAFSIYGQISDKHFCEIAQEVRERGFHFNS